MGVCRCVIEGAVAGLLQVTVSWHTHPSDDQASLEHMWLHMSDHGEVRILNLGDELVITNTALPDALEAALR